MFHLIQGEDEYRVALERDKIQSGFTRGGGVSVERYDGRERKLDMTEFFQAVSTQSFFEPKKLVILEYAGEFFDKEKNTFSKGNGLKILEEILDYGDDVCVILCAAGKKIAKNTKIYKLIEQKGKLLELDRMWYDPNEGITGQLRKWVGDEIKKRKLDLSEHQIMILVGRVGSDLRLIAGELDKIAIYLDGESVKTLDDKTLRELVPPGRDLLIFHLLDAVANKDLNRAMVYLGELLQSGTNEVQIIVMLHRQYRQIYSLLLLKKAETDQQTIMSELGLKPFTMRKLEKQFKMYSLKSLPRTFSAIITADAELKNSLLPGRTILEKMIIRIAG